MILYPFFLDMPVHILEEPFVVVSFNDETDQKQFNILHARGKKVLMALINYSGPRNEGSRHELKVRGANLQRVDTSGLEPGYFPWVSASITASRFSTS